MPKELPGFFFDVEKNRYFPYKGPIPGSSSKPPSVLKPSDSKAKEADILCQSIKRQRLLQARELWGNVISSRKGKLSFRTEYLKSHASQPTIWKYEGTKKIANFALGHVVADVSMPHGLVEKDILVGVGANGMLHFFPVGKVEYHMDSHKANCVWPLNVYQRPRHKELIKNLASSCATRTYLPSDISCIMLLRKSSMPADAMSKQILVTTLGSDSASGSVYLMDLSQPIRLDVIFPAERFQELASFKQTIWAADCDLETRRAAVGTNRGVILLNMETGASSWVFRCKSDVLSMQLKQSGNSILCGLRNGTIMTVDTRQKQDYRIKSRTDRSSTVSMPSSVFCLASLEVWDQYFLASSMDGSIKLYDHRQLQKGPVQSYEGNVNSHTRIELGVDPSERVVMSGGEDYYLRLWDIKSGELLFRERFMNSIPSAVCWPRQSSSCIIRDAGDYRSYWEEHSLGAWIGSYEGIFYMDWL